MPQIEKVLHGDLQNIEDKIHFGMFSICPLTMKRGRWETTVNGVKSVLIVYEQHAMPVYKKPDKLPEDWPEDYTPSWFNLPAQDYFQQAPHYSLSIMLVDTGEEIRLVAMSSGSGQDHLFIPDSGGEFGIYEALDLTLENLDTIFV